MKTDKNVSRRQFLLLGALTGGGLVLSESGCAPTVKQTSVIGGGNPLPLHRETTLRQVVEMELQNAYPILRDSSDEIIGVFNIKGDANCEKISGRHRPDA